MRPPTNAPMPHSTGKTGTCQLLTASTNGSSARGQHVNSRGTARHAWAQPGIQPGGRHRALQGRERYCRACWRGTGGLYCSQNAQGGQGAGKGPIYLFSPGKHGHLARPPCTAMHARYSRPCTIQPTMHYNACSQSGTPTDNTECICKRDSKNRIRAVLVGEHDYLGSDAQLVAQPVLQPPTARHTGY